MLANKEQRLNGKQKTQTKNRGCGGQLFRRAGCVALEDAGRECAFCGYEHGHCVFTTTAALEV